MKIKAAIVGTGFIAKQHYEAIRRLPNTEVVAVVGVNEADAKGFADTYGVDNYYTDIETLIKNESLDVLHICTPNALHYPMSKLALENEVNVFCEKPLALSSEESGDLVRIAKNTKTLHGVNLNYRSNAMVREMKSRIEKGQIGDLLLIHANYIQDWLMFDTDFSWHMDPKQIGSSRTVADIGTHTFDMIQFVTGQKIKKVFANFVTAYPVRKQREQIGETFAHAYTGDIKEIKILNEDAAIIIAELEDGTKASINLSQITGGNKNNFSVSVSGSKEALTWHQETADRLHIGKRDTGNEEVFADAKYLNEDVRRFISLPNGHAVGWADAFKNSIHEFYQAILHKDDPSLQYVDFNQGHYLMKIADACVESNKTNQWIEID